MKLTLKALLNRKGVTAYQMSKDTGIAESTLSDIANGKRKEVKLKTAIEMSIYLNVDARVINELLKGTSNEYEDKDRDI